MDYSRKKLIVIVGPTAVGKTALSLELARRLKTEIISADSRQIYREINIGTAKPSPAELSMIPHHFVNSHSIQQIYDAATYGTEALQRIYALFQTHSHIILTGGSGLYVKAVVEGFDEIPDIDHAVRHELIEGYKHNGLTWLQKKMEKLDPGYFQTIDRLNPHRLMRALEVKIGTGKSITSFQKQNVIHHPFHIVKIGLELERTELYQRIDKRMDMMIDAGLFNEAEALYAYKHHNALQTVGYQEIFGYMDGNYSYDEAIQLLKRNSRRYAKRQLTWFKRDSSIHWFHPNDEERIFSFIIKDSSNAMESHG